MSKVFETDVVIVGGGPVGLVAAMDLDARGIRSVVIESRVFMAAPNVKCNHISSRTMERFRQLGIADKVRASGLPQDYPQDVAFFTTMTGTEIARILIPSAKARKNNPVGPDANWPTPEPPHRVNQRYLEPILMEHANSLELVTLLTETDFVDFTQDADGVTTRATGKDGEAIEIRAKYMIGADGGRSVVRKMIGSSLSGDPVLSYVQSTLIKAPGLYEKMGGPAWAYYLLNPRRNGHVYSIDGKEEFLVHNYVKPDEGQGEDLDRDYFIRTFLGVDDSFEYSVLSIQDWVARRLVADRFRKDRVFIAGDASHLWVPYAGYGMNAGIADGLNLTFVLAAHLNGWASEGILDAYELERQPITEQVSRFAMAHQKKIAAFDVPDSIEDDTPEGEEARKVLGQKAYDLNVQQFAAAGLNYGYSYSGSNIISYDGEEPPAYTMGSFTASTVPGCRLPHFWVADGVSLYDQLGLGYTLIARADLGRVSTLTEAFAAAQVPLTVLSFAPDQTPAEYKHDFIIVRGDQHVAWRGDEAPADAAGLVDLLTGKVPV
jgi:2-polyprenyl-6-methoxyphenol hydroxylase-like FAD-dependent oxidoreductase